MEKEMTAEEKRDMRARIERDYNWQKIAEQTISVYEKALKNSRKPPKQV